jgi:hypothetical protein
VLLAAQCRVPLAQSVLTITYAGGNQREIEYHVHVENGTTCWSEYYFNGELYGRK